MPGKLLALAGRERHICRVLYITRGDRGRVVKQLTWPRAWAGNQFLLIVVVIGGVECRRWFAFRRCRSVLFLFRQRELPRRSADYL